MAKIVALGMIACFCAWAFVSDALADSYMDVTCDSSTSGCEGSRSLGYLKSFEFRGRCSPKRFTDQCNMNTGGTTRPINQKCSGSDSKVTCTITVGACGSNSYDSCSCTNWGTSSHTAKVQITCK